MNDSSKSHIEDRSVHASGFVGGDINTGDTQVKDDKGSRNTSVSIIAAIISGSLVSAGAIIAAIINYL